MHIVSNVSEEWTNLAKCFAIVVEALERNPEQDFLGELYMELELGNHWKGQFFTPYCVCKNDVGDNGGRCGQAD